MKQEFIRHKLAYLALFLGLGGLLILFMAAWPNRLWQRVVIASLVLFYFAWGVITHLKTDHITKRVVYEYLGVAVLAGLLLFLITL